MEWRQGLRLLGARKITSITIGCKWTLTIIFIIFILYYFIYLFWAESEGEMGLREKTEGHLGVAARRVKGRSIIRDLKGRLSVGKDFWSGGKG